MAADFCSLWHTVNADPPRFIVACPTCGDDEQQVTRAMQSPEMCVLCCGHGRVPRTVAERYELTRRLASSQRRAA